MFENIEYKYFSYLARDLLSEARRDPHVDKWRPIRQ
jgi:hypothetical protein